MGGNGPECKSDLCLQIEANIGPLKNWVSQAFLLICIMRETRLNNRSVRVIKLLLNNYLLNGALEK